MDKLLILVRHAHRNKPMGRTADNGLSSKGKLQTKALTDQLGKILSDRHPLILSSPKRRCVETVEPIADKFELRIEALEYLDEQGAFAKSEKPREFRARVEAVLDWWREEAPDTVLFSTHGDWVPVAMQSLVGTGFELKKGGFAIFSFDGETAKLEAFVQCPSDFISAKPKGLSKKSSRKAPSFGGALVQ